MRLPLILSALLVPLAVHAACGPLEKLPGIDQRLDSIAKGIALGQPTDDLAARLAPLLPASPEERIAFTDAAGGA